MRGNDATKMVQIKENKYYYHHFVGHCGTFYRLEFSELKRI